MYPQRLLERPAKLDDLQFGVEMKVLSLDEIIIMRGNDLERENDPIIAIEKIENDKKVVKVYDGNGRLARHRAECKDKIEVYLGKWKNRIKRKSHKP